MPNNAIKELLIEQLKDLYDAEYQLTQAMPKMARAATDPALVAAFEEHLAETEDQITRLEAVFVLLDEEPERKSCKAMQGLLKEGAEVIKEHSKGTERDLLLIAAAQRVEHYEIAGYGTVVTMAKLSNQNKVAEYLQETLDEEGVADRKLTEVAMELYTEV